MIPRPSSSPGSFHRASSRAAAASGTINDSADLERGVLDGAAQPVDDLGAISIPADELEKAPMDTDGTDIDQCVELAGKSRRYPLGVDVPPRQRMPEETRPLFAAHFPPECL
jgi:hypothetical protein